MKSLILICLVAFTAALTADECRTKKMTLSRGVETCMDANGGTPADILNTFKPTALQYTESDTDFSELDAALQLNCPRMFKSIECLFTYLEPIPGCQVEDEYYVNKAEATKLKLNGMKSATEYLCANNGEVIKQLIPNNGLKLFLSNEDFSECISNIFQTDHIGMVCPLIESTAECVNRINKEDYSNTYIPVVGQYFRNEWTAIGKC